MTGFVDGNSSIEPFAARPELYAKIRLAGRRNSGESKCCSGGVLLDQISFGPLSLDLAALRVWSQGVELKLRPQAFHALKVLIEKSGQYVDYDQLIREAWDGNVVSLHTVNTTIGAVRKALGNYGSWISYRPKLGYRLQVPGSDDLIRTAWHLYNRRTREGFETALNYFRKVVENDPADHRAFEGMAQCYLMLALFGMRAPREMHLGFTEAHGRAAALGWTPELRSMYAHGLHMFERRFEEAEAQFLRALRDKPLASTYVRLALLYSTMGRLDDALKVAAQARKMDPLLPTLAATEIFLHLCLGNFDAAIVCGKKGLELHPYLHLHRAYYAQALEYAGWVEEALAEYRLARVIAPDITWVQALEARCLARNGQHQQAEDIAEELVETRLTEYVDAYYVALLLDALGHRDDAWSELERAVEENSATLYMLDVDPKLQPLRTDPRFERLRNKLFGMKIADPVHSG
jgi:tetratricopeptide (TPR) repeat protein